MANIVSHKENSDRDNVSQRFFLEVGETTRLLGEVVAAAGLSADAGGYLEPYFFGRIGGSLTCLSLADVGSWLCVHRVSSPKRGDYLSGAIKLFRAGGDDPIRYVFLPQTSHEFIEARVASVSHDYNLQRRGKVEVQRGQSKPKSRWIPAHLIGHEPEYGRSAATIVIICGERR